MNRTSRSSQPQAPVSEQALGAGAETVLPPLHASWMSRIVPEPLPPEPHAACDRCAMCTEVEAGAESFNPQTKCCTYLPALPNFLAGAVLADSDPAGEPGRASVRARIAAGVAVSPLGLGRPATYGLLYAHGGVRTFGHALSMRCPHYLEDGGRCGIWRHRNAVCATWFCKHERGASGWRFWDSVRALLSAIEAELARACLVQLDVDAAVIETSLPRAGSPDMEHLPVTAAELDGRSDPTASRAAWGSWAGREIEFYRACASYVGDLAFDDVLRLCGQEVELRIRVVRAAWNRLKDPEPPSHPRVGPLQVIGCGPEGCRVVTYSVHDPLEVPRALFDVLHHFDGRDEADARDAIAREEGLTLTRGVVRKLADFGVLVDADAERPPETERARGVLDSSAGEAAAMLDRATPHEGGRR